MVTYSVFVGSEAAFVTQDKRKAKKAYRKMSTVVEVVSSAWGEKTVRQVVTLWQDSMTIAAK